MNNNDYKSIEQSPFQPHNIPMSPSTYRLQPKVLVIVTGGTICMIDKGLSSSLRPASLVDKLKELTAAFKDDYFVPYDVLEWDQLIDSSDINLTHWVRLARDIQKNYAEYEGFVILHGTDTLAYTASALSFILENLNKPVILTGAMLPMHHVQTDARQNVSVALFIAAYTQITEVCILFGSQLLRGNRSTKVDSSRMEAFKSPNFPPLGQIGIDIQVDERLTLMPSKRGFHVFPYFCMNIVVVTITPGFQPNLLRSLFKTPTRPLGVLLRLYGSGTAPMRDAELPIVLKEGLDSGVEIVSLSQCTTGTCSLLTYENGAMLYHLGVIEGKDMTVEAAFTKLGYLMGKGYCGDKLRYFMETDIRGEIKERPSTVTGQASLTPLFSGGSFSTKGLPKALTPQRRRKMEVVNNDEPWETTFQKHVQQGPCVVVKPKITTEGSVTLPTHETDSEIDKEDFSELHENSLTWPTKLRPHSSIFRTPASSSSHKNSNSESFESLENSSYKLCPRICPKSFDDIDNGGNNGLVFRRLHTERQPVIKNGRDECFERAPRTCVVPKEIIKKIADQ